MREKSSISFNLSNNLLNFIFQNSGTSSEMKKSSASVLKSVGGDSGKLLVYSEPNYQGEEHTFKDTAGKINETPWKGKSVKSLIVQGNPWLFYPDELCKVSYGYTICTSN